MGRFVLMGMNTIFRRVTLGQCLVNIAGDGLAPRRGLAFRVVPRPRRVERMMKVWA